MHQRELLRTLASESATPQGRVKTCVDTFLTELRSELLEDHPVEIPDFGRLSLVDQGARWVRPPGHATPIAVPGRKRLSFEPHPELETPAEPGETPS